SLGREPAATERLRGLEEGRLRRGRWRAASSRVRAVALPQAGGPGAGRRRRWRMPGEESAPGRPCRSAKDGRRPGDPRGRGYFPRDVIAPRAEARRRPGPPEPPGRPGGSPSFRRSEPEGGPGRPDRDPVREGVEEPGRLAADDGAAGINPGARSRLALPRPS